MSILLQDKVFTCFNKPDQERLVLIGNSLVRQYKEQNTELMRYDFSYLNINFTIILIEKIGEEGTYTIQFKPPTL